MLTPAELTALLAGLAFGLSLIVVIGAQNTYVLRVGLLRRHVSAVVAVCAGSDVVLIAAGVGGAGVALDGRPLLLRLVRVVGAIFLLGLGAMAAGRALRTHGEALQPATGAPQSVARAAAVALALTWLNPAVYLDTLVLLGSVANTRAGHQWWFGAGAAIGSVLWFTGLGYGAHLLAPLFRRPVAWRYLDAFVALVMTTTAVRLLVGL